MRRRDRLTDRVLDALVRDGAARWERFERRRPAWHTCMHADWRACVAPLRALRAAGCCTFLECGSGLGVVTIVADLLGFDAYGIELDPWLHDQSLDLAEAHGAGPTFALGSFVPAVARDDLAHDSAEFLTIRDGDPAYDELGMDLRDFDAVYAFPWPGEEDRFLDLCARHARRDARVVLYSAAEGYRVFVGGREKDGG